MLDSWIDHNGHDDITATSMMVNISGIMPKCLAELFRWMNIQLYQLSRCEQKDIRLLTHSNMGVSMNGGTPKWMVYNGQCH